MPSTTYNRSSSSASESELIHKQDALPLFSKDKQTFILPPPSSLPGYHLPLPPLLKQQQQQQQHYDDVSTAAATLASFAYEDEMCSESQVIEVNKENKKKKNFFLTFFFFVSSKNIGCENPNEYFEMCCII